MRGTKIDGTDGKYLVDSTGRVYSYYVHRYLKPDTDEDGYQIVTLKYGEGYKKKKVHRLVAEAYIDNPENHPVVNHLDGNTGNNRVSNLEWCTHSRNTKHAIENGLMTIASGEDCSYAKLDNEKVEQIVERIKEGLPYSEISEEFQISPATISMIKNGKRWTTTAIKNTTVFQGSNNGQSKLNEEKVKEIFELLKEGMAQSKIAKLYEVDKALISSIARGKSWTHVETDYVYVQKSQKALSEDQELALVNEYKLGGITRKQIAEKFGVSKSLVDKILRNNK